LIFWGDSNSQLNTGSSRPLVNLSLRIESAENKAGHEWAFLPIRLDVLMRWDEVEHKVGGNHKDSRTLMYIPHQIAGKSHLPNFEMEPTDIYIRALVLVFSDLAKFANQRAEYGPFDAIENMATWFFEFSEPGEDEVWENSSWRETYESQVIVQLAKSIPLFDAQIVEQSVRDYLEEELDLKLEWDDPDSKIDYDEQRHLQNEYLDTIERGLFGMERNFQSRSWNLQQAERDIGLFKSDLATMNNLLPLDQDFKQTHNYPISTWLQNIEAIRQMKQPLINVPSQTARLHSLPEYLE